MRIDLHTHTKYSPDSTMSPAELVERARAAGLERIAVTDHNRMDGAFEAWSIDPSLVILAEEVDCADGSDLIGLFLTEPVPSGLSVEETAERIRDQGGVVYAPHPFSYLRSAGRRAAAVLAVADVVEAFNARAFVPAWNRRALAAARAHDLPIVASSDGHFPREIGLTCTEVPPFRTATQFMRVVRKARLAPGPTRSPLIHARSLSTELARRAWWSLPFGQRPAFRPELQGA